MPAPMSSECSPLSEHIQRLQEQLTAAASTIQRQSEKLARARKREKELEQELQKAHQLLSQICLPFPTDVN